MFFVSVLTEAECVEEMGCVCTSLLSFSMPLCTLHWHSYEIAQSVPRKLHQPMEIYIHEYAWGTTIKEVQLCTYYEGLRVVEALVHCISGVVREGLRVVEALVHCISGVVLTGQAMFVLQLSSVVVG